MPRSTQCCTATIHRRKQEKAWAQLRLIKQCGRYPCFQGEDMRKFRPLSPAPSHGPPRLHTNKKLVKNETKQHNIATTTNQVTTNIITGGRRPRGPMPFPASKRVKGTRSGPRPSKHYVDDGGSSAAPGRRPSPAAPAARSSPAAAGAGTLPGLADRPAAARCAACRG